MGEYRSLPSIDRPWLHGFGSGGVEDPHGRWWRNYRANYWLGFGRTVDQREQEPRWNVHVGGEWVHLSKVVRRVGLKVSTTGEETLDVHVYGGPLFTHYWDLTVERFTAMGEKRGRQFPRRRQLRLPPVRFVVQVGLTGADWCFGSDDGSRSAKAPLSDRLRRNRVTWWRYAKAYRRGHPEVIRTATATVPLPEGGYEVDVKLEREVRQTKLGPLWLIRGKRRQRGPSFWLPWGRRVGWTAQLDAGRCGGLPFPGKGENSWDCGQDGLFGIGCTVREPDGEHDREWIAEVVGTAVKSVLRSRARYGSSLTDTGA